MANAAERNEKNRRRNLLEKLGEIEKPALVKYVKDNSLPGATKDWTTEQIEAAVNAVHPGVKKEAVKATKAAAKPSERHYSVQYENGKAETVKVLQFKSRAAADVSTQNVVEGWTGHSVTTAADLAGVATPILLAIVNKVSDTPVTRYANKTDAQDAAFSALERVVDSSKPKKAKKESAPREHKPVAYTAKAKDQIKTVRAGSKVALMIDLLARPNGTTLDEITTTLSAHGQPIRVRGWLSYDLSSVVGYGAREEGGRVYLVLPKGMTAPLAHKTKEEKAPKAPKAPKAVKETPAVVEETPAAPGKVRRPGGDKSKATPVKTQGVGRDRAKPGKETGKNK